MGWVKGALDLTKLTVKGGFSIKVSGLRLTVPADEKMLEYPLTANGVLQTA